MDRNRDSAMFWLPKIQSIGLPIPRTVVVPYCHREFVALLEGEGKPKWIDMLPKQVEKACIEIGYPCFLRTDLSSAKHDGPDSYLIASKKNIKHVLSKTVEDNEMKFWLDLPEPSAFLVREFLDLDFCFTAFGGLPIAREWRLFADEHHLICAHPYWPAEAIKFHGKPPRNWKKKLSEFHIKPSDFADLKRMAIRAAKECEGEWSVDFAMDKSGKWWLIDMATKEHSWHWPGCKN